MKKKIGFWIVLIVCLLAFCPMQVRAEECQHEWGEWEIMYDSTCNTHGAESRYCKLCWLGQERELPIGDHCWGEWECIRKADAFRTGYYKRECECCGKVNSKTTPKLKSVKTTTKLENEVKRSATAFLAAAKKYDVKKLKSCFRKKPSLFYSKKYIASFVRKSNKKYMKYVITSIKMKGKKDATVTVSCKYQNAYDIFYQSFFDTVNYITDTGNTNSYVLDKYQYDRVVKYNKKYKKHFTIKTFDINMKKIGKKWKITSFTKKMKDAIHCNYQSSYNEYFEDV